MFCPVPRVFGIGITVIARLAPIDRFPGWGGQPQGPVETPMMSNASPEAGSILCIQLTLTIEQLCVLATVEYNGPTDHGPNKRARLPARQNRIDSWIFHGNGHRA